MADAISSMQWLFMLSSVMLLATQVQVSKGLRMPGLEDGNASSIITPQLVLTGVQDTYDKLPANIRANVDNTVKLSAGLKIRYLNNVDCRMYLASNFDPYLVSCFDSEAHGSYRGDLCRAAVLYREGGFYTDLDLQLLESLWDLVDGTTTFMSVRSYWTGIMNALMGAKPHSVIMRHTLQRMRRWYQIQDSQEVPLGPVTLERGVRDTMSTLCAEEKVEDFLLVRGRATEQEIHCGGEVIRLYNEDLIVEDCKGGGSPICPTDRARSSFDGTKYAIFSPGAESREIGLRGWSHLPSCEKQGCDANGGVPS